MDLEEFPRTVERIRQRAAREGRLLDNPSDDELRPIVQKEPLARIDYVSISDPRTLEELSQIKGAALVSMAVYVGKTRLIDNLTLGE